MEFHGVSQFVQRSTRICEKPFTEDDWFLRHPPGCVERMLRFLVPFCFTINVCGEKLTWAIE